MVLGDRKYEKRRGAAGEVNKYYNIRLEKNIQLILYLCHQCFPVFFVLRILILILISSQVLLAQVTTFVEGRAIPHAFSDNPVVLPMCAVVICKNDYLEMLYSGYIQTKTKEISITK